MDALDRASEIELLNRKLALDSHQSARKKMAIKSLSHCIECEEEIPLKRQQAIQGCRHCVECQALIEKRLL